MHLSLGSTLTNPILEVVKVGQQSLVNPCEVNLLLQLHVTSPGPPYHPPPQQLPQPWVYGQESSIGVSLDHPMGLHQQGLVAAPGNMLDVICKPPAHYTGPTLGILYLLKDILASLSQLPNKV